MNSTFLQAVDARGIATLTLNRHGRHNAFRDVLITELAAALRWLGEETGRRIALRRASAEGREGIGAFLDKRPPAWRQG
jgi:methylglutaconyl-CoA hydratase